MSSLESLKNEVLQDLERVKDLQGLENIRVSFLGKSGKLTLLMKELGKMDPDERKVRGAALNSLKVEISDIIDTKKAHFEEADINERLQSETIDVSLPPRMFSPEGKIHPISQVLEQSTNIFAQMGFVVKEGPDIEEDFYNFSALNIPPEHPARQEQDTFYLPSKDGQPLVLRTHTSPVQIRTMIDGEPPFRIIAPGRVYRSDYDATHTPMFHQIEGLVVDTETNMGHLKGCLEEFFRFFFEDPDMKIRFRPGYFPFTEPSAEVDILWKGDTWLEVLGCGMVHPNVLKNCNIDPEKYQGYAFGMGVERLAMLKYGMEDLRPFFESDLQWLGLYGFYPEERE